MILLFLLLSVLCTLAGATLAHKILGIETAFDKGSLLFQWSIVVISMSLTWDLI